MPAENRGIMGGHARVGELPAGDVNEMTARKLSSRWEGADSLNEGD